MLLFKWDCNHCQGVCYHCLSGIVTIVRVCVLLFKWNYNHCQGVCYHCLSGIVTIVRVCVIIV